MRFNPLSATPHAGDDSPELHQPLPEAVMVARSGGVTAIARVWAPGDGAKCRLCARGCGLTRDTCLVLVPGHVPDREAALYGIGRKTWRPV